MQTNESRKEKRQSFALKEIMKKTVISLIIATMLASATAPALQAQNAGSAGSSARERLQRIMDPSADVEEFRHELDGFYTDMEASMNHLLESEFARVLVARAGLDPLGQLIEARKKLPALTAHDLGFLKAAFAKNPNWRELPERLDSLLRPEIREGLKKMRVFAAVTPSPVSTLPGGIIQDNCNDAFNADGSPRVSNTDISIAQAFVIAGEIVMESLPTDVLTFEAHAVAAGVLGGLKGAVLVVETFKNISDDCSGANFENYVTANLNEQVSTRASQTSVNTVQATANSIVDRLDERLDVKVSTRATQESVNAVQQSVNLANSKLDIANGKLDQLLANLAALQAQHLRLQIEANLANGTNDAAIGQFALPAAQSGYLELARSILVETIQKLQATGQGIRNAPTYLAQGDQQKAAGRFKEAYDSYSQAYRAATGH